MEYSSESIQWNVQFSRLIQDWEVGDLAAFYKCLYEYKIRGEGRDKLWWMPSRKGVFEVKSFYRARMAPYYYVMCCALWVFLVYTTLLIQKKKKKKGSIESGILCLVSRVREDSHYG
jgi:hypothetical protein